MNQNNPTIGFFKAVQGAFTDDAVAQIKQRVSEQMNATIVDVDFRDGVLIDGKVYVGEVCLNDFDIYFWHDTLWPAKTGSDSYYIHLLRAIGRDVRVINTADSTEVVNDKLRAHELLRRAGLPVSGYALVHSESKAGIAQAYEKLGGDVLIKPRFGGWGKGIVRCKSLGDLHDVIELAAGNSGRQQQFLLERFYDNDISEWISVSMIGQLPVIGYRKPLSIGNSDWKVFDPDKRDGKGELSVYVQPATEVVELAKKAQAAIGKDIIGFDFILTPDGYKIVDENGRPGLYAHCLKAAGIDLVDTVSDYIVQAARS
ncbi:MAG: hypothetical protein V4678_04495 [Patescibacteria group bacterium]